MTVEEMKKRKIELGYSNRTLAEKSGVPVGTLQKIFSGETSAPREDTVRALERVLKKEDGFYRFTKPPVFMLKEDSTAYRVKEGGYTLEDYLALPEDERFELIDGVLIKMDAPATRHQGIAGYIYGEFRSFVRRRQGTCFPMISPVDVQLDCDDKTIVEPDVLIICDRSKINQKRIFGAPDFVLEILSPSTRWKDMTLKYWKYSHAGVREYWILDPDRKMVVQYDLEHEELPKLFGQEDSVPVLIWEGECQIDLKDMFEELGFLWDTGE